MSVTGGVTMPVVPEVVVNIVDVDVDSGCVVDASVLGFIPGAVAQMS